MRCGCGIEHLCIRDLLPPPPWHVLSTLLFSDPSRIRLLLSTVVREPFTPAHRIRLAGRSLRHPGSVHPGPRNPARETISCRPAATWPRLRLVSLGFLPRLLKSPKYNEKTAVSPKQSRSASTSRAGWRRGQSPANPLARRTANPGPAAELQNPTARYRRSTTRMDRRRCQDSKPLLCLPRPCSQPRSCTHPSRSAGRRLTCPTAWPPLPSSG